MMGAMRSNAVVKWQHQPGDTLWSGSAIGLPGDWSLVYRADDGETWELQILHDGLGIGGLRPIGFQSETRKLIPNGADRTLSEVLGVVHEPLARHAGYILAPGSLHQRVVNAVAINLTKDEWIDGKLLRHGLRPAPKEVVNLAVTDLIPRYVRPHPQSDYGGEHYSLTLGGLLASTMAPRASLIIERVLQLLGRKFDRDPTFRTYDWNEVKNIAQLGDQDCRLAMNVINIAELKHVMTATSSGPISDFSCLVPEDIEDLQECRDLSAFLAYLQKGMSHRPSPTAPLRLAPASRPTPSAPPTPPPDVHGPASLPKDGVFISYSHDGDEHKAWVLDLAERLQQGGVTVIMDQFHLKYGDDITLFMEQAIDRSRHILVICTALYRQKADNREGGVGYEESIITAQRADRVPDKRFIPVWRGHEGKAAAPIWAKGLLACDLRGTPYSEAQFEKLLKLLAK